MAQAISESGTRTETSKRLAADLRAKQQQLNSLLQITEAINQNFSSEQLFSIYEFVLHNQLKVTRLRLFMFDGEWKSVLAYGSSAKIKNTEVKTCLDSLAKLIPVPPDAPVWMKEFDWVFPVRHKDNPLACALIGTNNEKEQDIEKSVLPFIQTITNIIVVAIENKRLAKEAIKQEGMRRELDLAAKMQAMLFPSKLPSNEKMEVAATYIPHQEVGGDYYDYVRLNEDELFACIADVSGKGISAALLMSNFQANLHAYLQVNADLPDLARRLNAQVMKTAKGEKFITVFMVKYNIPKRELRYVNAGHNPPFLYSDGKVHLLDQGTTGLGMLDELPFVNEGCCIIPPGSTLFCYTDGVVELENDSGISFGIERLEEFMKKNAHLKSLKDFHKKLVDHLTAFKQNQPFVDDITLFSSRGKAPY
jgi:sigma-B regulation protein RsbU (phosphoserine phosphatase)